MSHFYGTVRGAGSTEASRRGHAATGLKTTAASWNGAVQVSLYVRDGVDCAEVKLVPWHGRGVTRTLYDGPVNAELEA